MFGKKKKSPAKLSVQEFLELKARREKWYFRFQPYPWPVNLALLVPFLVLVLLFFTYFYHIKGVLG